MKLDWNLMRTILAHVEDETIEEFVNDANNLDEWKEGQLLSERRNRDQDASIRVVFSHIKLLVDSGYIEGLHVTESADGHFQIGIAANPSLTLDGYSLLETGFVDKLKAFAKEKTVPLTLGTIKLISAAAIQKLLL